jgi:hypothetical protein
MRISKGDVVSPVGDLLASQNLGICDTTHFVQPVAALRSKSRKEYSSLRHCAFLYFLSNEKKALNGNNYKY